MSGGLTSRIFHITGGASVRITGIKLVNGNGVGINSGFGGAILVDNGNLNLDAADVTNNTSSNVAGAVFIANSPNSRIAYSTVSFNTGTNNCGGIDIFNSTLYVVNSTFSDNNTPDGQGNIGLHNER